MLLAFACACSGLLSQVPSRQAGASWWLAGGSSWWWRQVLDRAASWLWPQRGWGLHWLAGSRQAQGAAPASAAALGCPWAGPHPQLAGLPSRGDRGATSQLPLGCSQEQQVAAKRHPGRPPSQTPPPSLSARAASQGKRVRGEC